MTAHSNPAELRASSICIFGKAAITAVLFVPTMNIARHDDNTTESWALRGSLAEEGGTGGAVIAGLPHGCANIWSETERKRMAIIVSNPVCVRGGARPARVSVLHPIKSAAGL